VEKMHKQAQSQVLRFQLGGESYAFDVLKAREVLSLVRITPLPSAMDFVSGVINLRGSVIPVVDLRKKFGLPPEEPTVDTSIIIVEIKAGDETTVIGAMVDSVKGVMLCEEKELEPPPRFGMKMNTNLIQAIAKKGETFVIILDADKVFSESEISMIRDQVPVDAGNAAEGE